VLAAAIGEEDEGDVVGLEVCQGAVCAWERVGAAKEDAIYARGRGLARWVEQD
jgi:hypothetical protein